MPSLTPPHPVGRLVAVLDATPHPLSLKAFSRAARQWLNADLGLATPTLLAGDHAESLAAFAARWPRLFYNAAEPAPLHALFGLLPWAEVWLVQQGQIWALTEGHLLAYVDPTRGEAGQGAQPLADEVRHAAPF
jgi:hypothetical protein